jgi:hypothetical protein
MGRSLSDAADTSCRLVKPSGFRDTADRVLRTSRRYAWWSRRSYPTWPGVRPLRPSGPESNVSG